jgi:hypothetical protein
MHAELAQDVADVPLDGALADDQLLRNRAGGTPSRSEPMRDVALVLWWMYPPSLWRQLLDRFRIDLNDQAQQERFYLYISIWALEVALFFANRQQPQWKQRFLRDAHRAYERQEPDELLLS